MAAQTRRLTVALNNQPKDNIMGDRCHMRITCRRKDQELFEEIGFHLDFDQTPDSAIIELWQEPDMSKLD